MKHPRLLYGLLAVLGFVFVALFFPNPMATPFLTIATLVVYSLVGEAAFSGTATWMLFSCFCSIIGAVFLPAGLCGIFAQYFESNQNLSAIQAMIAGDSNRNSKLFGIAAVLGAALLCTLTAMGVMGTYSGEARRFFMSLQYNLYVAFLVFCLFGGIGLLTVGVSGTARRHFKNHQNVFTIIVAILIPSLILLPFTYLWISSLTVAF